MLAQIRSTPQQHRNGKSIAPQDNAMIEEFFQKKSGTVALQNHVIHFKEKMQVSKSDFHKQRPVKREET